MLKIKIKNIKGKTNTVLKDKTKEAEAIATAQAKRAPTLRLTITTNRIKPTTTYTKPPMIIYLQAAELRTKTNASELKVSQRATDTDPNLQNTTMDNRRKKH